MVKERKIGGREHTLKSMLLPGMGKRAMQQKTNPIITIAYLGLVGTGVYSRIRSNQQYEAYKTETNDLNKRQELYDSANLLNKIAIVSGSSAAVLWLTDVISTFTLGTKNEQIQKELKTQMGISFNKANPPLNNKPPNDQNTLSLNFKLKF